MHSSTIGRGSIGAYGRNRRPAPNGRRLASSMSATTWNLPLDRPAGQTVRREAPVPAPRFFRGAMIGTAVGGAMWAALAVAITSLL